MLNELFRVSDYLQYLIASVGRNQIQDPILSPFLHQMFAAEMGKSTWPAIEWIRSRMIKSKAIIPFVDLGGGRHSGNRKLSEIALHTAKQAKYGKWLHRTIAIQRPVYALELGSGTGISTLYQLSAMAPNTRFISLEGDHTLAEIARYNASRIGLNAEIWTGDFAQNLPQVLAQIPRIDYAFIDGNHQKDPTLNYFNTLLQKTHTKTILIFDDIYWSEEMRQAWNAIKSHESVVATIDIFAMGMVFFDPQLQKNHYKLRY